MDRAIPKPTQPLHQQRSLPTAGTFKANGASFKAHRLDRIISSRQRILTEVSVRFLHFTASISLPFQLRLIRLPTCKSSRSPARFRRGPNFTTDQPRPGPTSLFSDEGPFAAPKCASTAL